MGSFEQSPTSRHDGSAEPDFRVLVVGEKSETLDALATALRRMTMDVHIVRNAEEALGVLEEGPVVHAILSAYPMKDPVGVELLERVTHRWPRIQRVLLTTRAQLDLLPEAMSRAGTCRCLWAPWNQNLLELTLRAAEEQHLVLEESDRLLATLDRLPGWLAHEINNPLTGILAFSQMMKVDEGRSPEDMEQLGYIETSARRCVGVIESLLEVGRPPPGQLPAASDLPLLVATARSGLSLLIGNGPGSSPIYPTPQEANPSASNPRTCATPDRSLDADSSAD